MTAVLDAHDHHIAMQSAIAIVDAENEDVHLIVSFRIVHIRFFIVALIDAQRALKNMQVIGLENW